MSSALLACVAVAGWLAAAPSAADGQVYVTGKVLTEGTFHPIEGVAVTVVDPDGEELATRLSTEAGRVTFLIDDAVPSVRLRAERIGYTEVVTPPVEMDRYRSVALQIRMTPGPITLEPLEVVASLPREISPFHRDFEHRRERGFGEYITREDIERRGPSRVSDLLRTMSGVRMESAGRGTRPVVTFGRSPAGPACPAQIYVDEFHLNRAGGGTFRIDDAVMPEEVYGIEVYRGLSSVPGEFMSPEAECGVIVIWTRRGPDWNRD